MKSGGDGLGARQHSSHFDWTLKIKPGSGGCGIKTNTRSISSVKRDPPDLSDAFWTLEEANDRGAFHLRGKLAGCHQHVVQSLSLAPTGRHFCLQIPGNNLFTVLLHIPLRRNGGHDPKPAAGQSHVRRHEYSCAFSKQSLKHLFGEHKLF